MVKTFCPKLHLLLVGAFSFQRKIPDCSSDLFFLQITDLTLKGPLFTETTKTTKAKSGQQKLSPKGPLFHFLLFRGNVQNRTSLKGPPFDFFFSTVRHFPKEKNFKNFKFFFIKMFCTFRALSIAPTLDVLVLFCLALINPYLPYNPCIVHVISCSKKTWPCSEFSCIMHGYN